MEINQIFPSLFGVPEQEIEQEDEEDEESDFNLTGWLKYIQIYSDMTKEPWKDVWTTNIYTFFLVVTYAKEEMRKEIARKNETGK